MFIWVFIVLGISFGYLVTPIICGVGTGLICGWSTRRTSARRAALAGLAVGLAAGILGFAFWLFIDEDTGLLQPFDYAFINIAAIAGA